MPWEGATGALLNEGVIRTTAISAHSRVVASEARRTRCPRTLVLPPVFVAVPNEVTSATAVAAVGLIDGGIADALYVRA